MVVAVPGQISSLKGYKSEGSHVRNVTNAKGHKSEVSQVRKFHVILLRLLEESQVQRVTSSKGHKSEWSQLSPNGHKSEGLQVRRSPVRTFHENFA